MGSQYVLTRVYVRVFGEPRAPKHGHTRCGPNVVGSPTFESASAFNANIGAWNTAALTMLSSVCAVPAVVRNAAQSCARSGFKCIYMLVKIEMQLYSVV